MTATTRSYNIDAGILSSVVVLGAFREASACGDNMPHELWLTGVVRDFQERTSPGGHPDFERVPDHGFGQYSGNVAYLLGADGKPVFTGLGSKISVPARDAAGRSIAPHLANKRCGVAVPASDCVTLQDSQGDDAYEICLVTAEFNEDGTSTWVYHVRELPGGQDLSHWNLKLYSDQTVLDGTTEGYEVGIDGSTGFYGIKWDVDDDFEEGDFTIVLDAHYAAETGPAVVLAKGGQTPDTGPMTAPSNVVSAAPSPLDGGPGLVDDPSLGDTPAVRAYSDYGAIQSSDTFDQWFRDTLGVNMSAPLTLRFLKDSNGVYIFDDAVDPEYADLGGFFPIEGRLQGNPGGTPDRNFHFTFELNAKFTYRSECNQFFRFVGDDDVWVFIDGKLVIDLGGCHGAIDQFVDLNRLCLNDGQEYTLDFFFAERHRNQCNVRIETNIELQPGDDTGLPTFTAAFD
ncbi:MAG: fibro-slime domain-containing protein [Planctomycetota bacterium]|jgi:fibro-slime domain-containing protein